MDRGAWQAAVHGVTETGHDWARMRLCSHHAQPWTWFSDRKKQALAGWRTLGRPSQSSHAWTNKFIEHCVQLVIASESRSLVSDCLQPQGLYSPWDSPGQNTGVGSLTLLQGIFPTQGSNLGLPHCRWILYQLSHQGSLRILEWVAHPFSSGSSWPRNRTGVYCMAGRFFTNWATQTLYQIDWVALNLTRDCCTGIPLSPHSSLFLWVISTWRDVANWSTSLLSPDSPT